MSPRQFGKVDISASWLPCPRCPHRHVLTAPCPPGAAWLVLAFCTRCSPTAYCRHHGSHRPPAPAPPSDAHHALPVVPEQAVVASRYEHEGVEGV